MMNLNKTVGRNVPAMIAGLGLAMGLTIAGGVERAEAATISAVFAQDGFDSDNGYINMGNTPSDCSGFFGQGFENCDIGNPLEAKESGSIAKFEPEGSEWETNTAYRPDISDAFALTNATENSGTGSFVYTAIAGDPSVRFWVAKQSTQFRLYWNVADALVEDGVCAGGDNVANYTTACIAGAMAVTAGSWTTPKGDGLSHVTFYNGEAPSPVPLPAAGWMLLASLGGLVAAKRRKA